MRAAGTLICGIPAECWGDAPARTYPTELLRRHLRALAASERRLGKGTAIEDERRRFLRLASQIEETTLANAWFGSDGKQLREIVRRRRFPAVRLSSEYVYLLRLLHLRGLGTGLAHPQRLGATVVAPNEVRDHLAAFEAAARDLNMTGYEAIQQRSWFIRSFVLPAHGGLVEIPDPTSGTLVGELEQSLQPRVPKGFLARLRAALRGASATRPPATPQTLEPATPSPSIAVGAAPANDWLRYGDPDRGRYIESRLRDQIADALERGVPVRLVNQRHRILIDGLQEFVHTEPGQPPAAAPLTYDDGRNPRPFPLRCLPRLPDGWRPTREMHVALVSMRHLALDEYIDFNWFRNADVQTYPDFADADEYCYQTSLEQLAELLRTAQHHRVRLHLYHTGYLPAILGFYRALTTTLASGAYRPGCLQVLPRPQPRGNDFDRGKPWPSG